MTIYEVLKIEGQTLLDLVDQLILSRDADERREIIQEVRDELVPLIRAEEWVLYHSIRQVDAMTEVVSIAFEEHFEVESILQRLQVTEYTRFNFKWESGARKLKETLQHHMSEEEDQVFYTAKRLFTEVEAMAMAEAFERMKPLVRGPGVMGQSLDRIANLMPNRLRDSFERLGKLSMSQAS